MSTPAAAKGSRPTAVSTEYRPPTSVGHHEALPPLGIRLGLEHPPGLVSGSVDAAPGPFLTIFLLQQGAEHPEGQGGLQGGARLGDDVDGPVLIPDELNGLGNSVSGQAVADKVHIRRVLWQQVIIGAFQQLQYRAGPQIGSADANDHQGLAVTLNASGGGLDA